MRTRCYIVGAGEFTGRELPGQGDFIVAADGGYARLDAHGITPDLIAGDFDSLGYVPVHPNIVSGPMEKDYTDLMLAVEQGLEHGCKSFVIDGGTGGRLDHTLANIQVLIYLAKKGARGVLLGKDINVTAITNGSLTFKQGASGMISIFCAGDRAEGVTLTGLKYPLDDATLTYDFPLGVSNEFSGKPATVAVRDGTLAVTWQGGLEALEAVNE